jgi:hypothetical protein
MTGIEAGATFRHKSDFHKAKQKLGGFDKIERKLK